jgi:RNA polymerase sigma-70 factor, ECF subfamily
MLSSFSDRELVSRAQRGDEGAFDELVRRHQSRLVNVACRLLGDLALAHDAAQDAFIAAWRALPRFRGDANFSTWVYRILYNTCLDYSRRRGRSLEVTFAEPDPDGPPIPEQADPDPTPDVRLEQRELHEMIESALGRIDPKHRAVLVFFDIEGLSYEEIAAVLRLPIGTVKSRLNRARHALRRELAPALEQSRLVVGPTGEESG